MRGPNILKTAGCYGRTEKEIQGADERALILKMWAVRRTGR
jgi:hypothetical protein